MIPASLIGLLAGNLLTSHMLSKPSSDHQTKKIETGPSVEVKEVEVIKNVEVIKEVPKIVEKVVEKVVEVPAEIPEIYKTALAFMESFHDAKLVSENDSLKGIESVALDIPKNEGSEAIAAEAEIRTKFELTLRRAGIVLDPNSRHRIQYERNTLKQDDGTTVYSHTVKLVEVVVGFRDGEPNMKVAGTIWDNGYFGIAGKNVVRSTFLSNAESCAEIIANALLSANPKPR